ncbi:hypothetical protein [Kitasatospora cathayae]|uniref:Uncharacterized protein n=1 Tax=Kitasatospora cathayae TaxID=3004092 RepID=A0ABY7QCM9_9ACTN|nr:hypothetical protein [Kitasatospora sp. HUAS 3-15]WBP90367.1 hypothetical protein O1G21_33930 [Kitasatospora sp. HUAS 3-15]
MTTTVRQPHPPRLPRGSFRRSSGSRPTGSATWSWSRWRTPGPPAPPRKIHLIYRTHVTPEVRATLATQEFDELPDGSHEVGNTEWIDYRKVGDLPLFPPIGKVLAQLPSPHAPVPAFALEPVTDQNHTWI